MYTGPNIINDGLVFGYDTAYGVADNDTATRFYQGKPTTNLAPSSLADWGIESGAVKTATGNYYNGQPTYNCRAKVGQSWVGIYKTISNLRTTAGSSGTVTLSCFVKNTNSSSYPLYAHVGHDFSSTKTIAANSDWQRVQWTVNQSSMSNDYVELRPYTNSTNVYLEMTMPQVEVNISTATPWLNGSRSSTASLIDLKKTTDIDVGNVSFGSTGQPEFDGTDDYILTPFTRGTLGDRLTIIAYYKYTGNSTRGYTPIFGGLESGTGTEFFIGKNSGNTSIGVQDGNYIGGFVTGSNAWDGNYHQIVYTYDNGTGKIYLDGVLKNSGSFTKCNSAEQITVGREAEGSGYWFLGDIPRVCVFDRVLTVDEILKNFNANKNRFNI